MPRFVHHAPGDPAPWFRQRSSDSQSFVFDTVAGRNIILCFVGSASKVQSQLRLSAALQRRALFDDIAASFFGVSNDPVDERSVSSTLPGYRFFWDFDLTVSRLYGAASVEGEPQTTRGLWVILDPTLHVVASIPFRQDGEDIGHALDLAAALPPPGRIGGMEVHAPVIILDRVFDRAFCARLIELYDSHGGESSGFMRDVDGQTRLIHDAAHKVRRDHVVEDRPTIEIARKFIRRRIAPEIMKVHQFRVTRMERYLVACYAAEDSAHFAPHRDNTTMGTAHRRFAVTINLNDDFDGGELYFPEYGPRRFKPPPGGAVAFSCSLLHAVAGVTRGKRYAFLPFLYDDAAAKMRLENLGSFKAP